MTKQIFFMLFLILSSSYCFAQDSLQLETTQTFNALRWSYICFENTSELTEESETELKKIVTAILTNPGSHFEIQDHTDIRGSEEANLKYSQTRIEWLLNYLINNGVNRDLIEGKAYGESKPLNDEIIINKYRRTDKAKFQLLHSENNRLVLRMTN